MTRVPHLRLSVRAFLAVPALALVGCDAPNPTATSSAPSAAETSLRAGDADLTPFIETGLYTRRVEDINDRGEISFTQDNRRQPGVWSVASGTRLLEPWVGGTRVWTLTNSGLAGGIDGGAGVIWTEAGRTVIAEQGSVEDMTESGLMAGEEDGVPTLWRNGDAEHFALPTGTFYGVFTGVSDAGYATGFVQGSHGALTGILLADGELQMLPELGSYLQNIAVDVNAAGQVVGWSQGGGRGDAFLYENGDLSTLPPLPGAAFSDAERITEDGLIVGASANLPVVWVDRQPVALPLPEGATSGRLVAVNETGQAVGHVLYPTGSPHRFQAIIWNLDDCGFAALRQILAEGRESGDVSNGGVANALSAHLESAIAAFAAGNDAAAAGKLGAFTQLVKAQAGRNVTADLASKLDAAAGLAISLLD